MALFLLAGCLPKANYPDGRGLEGQLEREVIALKQRNRILTDQVEQCGEAGPPSAIYNELYQVFADGEVQLSRAGAHTVVTLTVSDLFPSPHSLRVREEMRPTLDLLSMALGLHPELRVTITGHSDDASVPRRYLKAWPDPTSLTLAYALAVRAELIALGIKPERFVIAGAGGHQPVASNDVQEGQQRNRRVELLLEALPSKQDSVEEIR